MTSASRSSHTTFVPSGNPYRSRKDSGFVTSPFRLTVAIIGITPRAVVLRGLAMATMDCDLSRRSRRRASKVQQEPEYPGDGEERFVVRRTEASSRRLVVQGTTVTTPARLSFSRSADTTTAGRRPACSRLPGSPKSTSQMSPRRAVTRNGRTASCSPVPAQPRSRPTHWHRAGAPRRRAAPSSTRGTTTDAGMDTGNEPSAWSRSTSTPGSTRFARDRFR